MTEVKAVDLNRSGYSDGSTNNNAGQILLQSREDVTKILAGQNGVLKGATERVTHLLRGFAGLFRGAFIHLGAKGAVGV